MLCSVAVLVRYSRMFSTSENWSCRRQILNFNLGGCWIAVNWYSQHDYEVSGFSMSIMKFYVWIMSLPDSSRQQCDENYTMNAEHVVWVPVIWHEGRFSFAQRFWDAYCVLKRCAQLTNFSGVLFSTASRLRIDRAGGKVASRSRGTSEWSMGVGEFCMLMTWSQYWDQLSSGVEVEVYCTF
jgi:hypothetical protein